jgi:hypothetical protein
MSLSQHFTALPAPRWHGFESSILRRLQFRSIALPFAGEPGLEPALKRWGVRVATNDTFHWAWTKAVALVENNTERLTEDDLRLILEDVYVPRHRLGNPSLLKWFTEPDAWWFDNLRANLERLDNPVKQALALTYGMAVGDYVFSFDEETREYRSPLSQVFRRCCESSPPPVNNRQKNYCSHVETHEFLAEQNVDLLFLRLPPMRRRTAHTGFTNYAWREEWVRGDEAFWPDLEANSAGRLGGFIETKQQYLTLIEDLLARAAHIGSWAIVHQENSFVTTEELVEAVKQVRRVETIYTKDFSELTGMRAAIITAL